MKKCTKCGEIKPVMEFSKHAGKRDGLQSNCKACTSIARAAWQKASPDKVRERAAAWYAKNADKVKASSAKWRAENRDKASAAVAKWYAENPDYDANYRANNKEAFRIYVQNRRARKRENGGKLSKDISERLFKLQRGKCACCGKPLGEDYHLDHVMPLALGGANEDWNMQLLRQRCNNQKGAKHPIDFMQQRGCLL